MAHTSKKLVQRRRRKAKVRKQMSGTAERPRLTVFRSNKHIYAQVIDDDAGSTLAAASSQGVTVDGKKKDVAKAVGALVAERAKAAGVSVVSFDRNGYKYHGLVAALATGTREGGLEF